LLKAQFRRRLKQVERDLVQVDAAILSVIAQDETLSESAKILTRIPGIATETACEMLTQMPELGTLSGKQAASLAGLAPLSGHCCAMPCRATNVTPVRKVAGARAYSRGSR
jgi:transposase